MEKEKKKALIELIKECDDAEYLKQISYTALVMANAVAAIKKAENISNKTKLSFTAKAEGGEYVSKINIDDVPRHSFDYK